MAEKVVAIRGTKDKLKVVTKPEGTFYKAFLNDREEGHITTVVDEDRVIDLERLEQDVNNPPVPPVPPGGSKRITYLYVTPIRDVNGNIVKWYCCGSGNKTCPG